MSNQYDEAVESLRRKICELPRYSFLMDGNGNVVRVPDDGGRWIEWDEVHKQFDPEMIDAAIAEMRVREIIAAAKREGE